MKNKLSILIVLIVISTISCNSPNTEFNSKNDSIKKPLSKKKNEQKLKDTIATNLRNTNKNLDKDLSITEFLRNSEKKNKIYSISNSKDEIIKCSEGTIIKVKANSFEFEDGTSQAITEIKIEIKEYYSVSDILLSSLSTMSNGKLLETGGMIDIMATSMNKRLKLKDNSNLKILFPIKNKKSNMKLFNGSKVSSGDINWELAEQFEDLNNNRIIRTPDKIPNGGDLLTFLKKNIKYPKQAMEKFIEGSVFIGCIITETGKVEDPRLLQGLGFGCDEEAIRVVKLLPDFGAASLKGRPVSTLAVVPVKFVLSGRDVGIDIRPDFTKKLEEKYADYLDRIITDINKDEMNYYVFNSKHLGLVNCDRFIEEINSTTLFVNEKSQKNAEIKIVFDRIKSIMNGKLGENGFSFKNIPIGEEITIIGLKYKDNQPLLALKKITISKDIKVDIEYSPVTIRELKNKLDSF